MRYDAHLRCAESLRRSGDMASMVMRCHWCKRQFQVAGWEGMKRMIETPVAGQVGLVYQCEQCEGARAMGFRSWVQLEDEVGIRRMKRAAIKGGAA